MKTYISAVVVCQLLCIGTLLAKDSDASKLAASQNVSANSFLNGAPVGVLGKTLGSRTVIEGMRANHVMLSNPLVVEKVDGHVLPSVIAIELSGLEEIKFNTRYTLEGYESGSFLGQPEWLSPGVQQPFQYHPSFVVTRVIESTDGFQEKDPVRFVSEFYKFKLHPRSTPRKLNEFQPWISQELYALLLKAESAPAKPNEVPPLDFDPFTGSQEDLELVKVEPVNAKSAVVRVWVKVKNDKTPFSFIVYLGKHERHWVLTDIRFEQKDVWYLVEFLKKSCRE